MEHLINTLDKLSHVLRARRKDLGDTQADAADRTGLLTKTVSLLENQPGKSTVESLFKYLSSLKLEIVLQDKSAHRNPENGEW